MNVPRKYGLLRFVAFLLKLLAWLVLLAGIIGTALGLVFLTAQSGNQPEIFKALSAVGVVALPIISIIWFVQFFAFGSILTLLIDMEENTRLLAARSLAPAPES